MIQSVRDQGSVGSKFSLLGSGLSEGLGSGCSERRLLPSIMKGSGLLPALLPALKTTSVPGVLGPILSPHPAHALPRLCSTPGSHGVEATHTHYAQPPPDSRRRGSRWEVLPCIPNWPSETQQGQSAFWPECIPKPRRSSLGLAQVFLLATPLSPLY